MANIKRELRNFIASKYLKSEDSALGNNDSLLSLGIIDSIGVIELVQFIQEKYKIKITVTEIIPENLDTLDDLEKFISRKLKIK
jgi:acyl carrier protein